MWTKTRFVSRPKFILYIFYKATSLICFVQTSNCYRYLLFCFEQDEDISEKDPNQPVSGFVPNVQDAAQYESNTKNPMTELFYGTVSNKFLPISHNWLFYLRVGHKINQLT